MICSTCGGPTYKQDLSIQGTHRYKDDCIAYLKLAISQLETRAAFGDQCYQDQCENAYIEQSVVDRRVREVKVKLDDAEWLLASTTDLLNSWARELGVAESERKSGIRLLADRIWSEVSRRMLAAPITPHHEPAGTVQCLDCDAKVPYGNPCQSCGLGS